MAKKSTAYESKRAIPNKVLNDDGTITDLLGNAVVNSTDVYDSKVALPNKLLNPDGSYSTFQDILGGSVSGDLFIVVEELPSTGEENKIYMVPKDGGSGYTEWTYKNGSWEPLGEVDIDLSNYSTTEQMNAAIQQYVASNTLTKTNTTAFTPTADYHPATKSYVDNNIYGLGAFSKYTQDNRLDIGKLPVGSYLLYRDVNTIYLKATYKGDVITGSFTASTGRPNVILSISKKITDDLPERSYVGEFSRETMTDGASSEIRYDMTSVQIGTGYIVCTSGSYQVISPVERGRTQTITGEKTFSTLPKSSVVPTDNTHLVNKKYVDDTMGNYVVYNWDGNPSSTTASNVTLFQSIVDDHNAGKNVLILRSADLQGTNFKHTPSVIVFDAAVTAKNNEYALEDSTYMAPLLDPSITSGNVSYLHQEQTRVIINLDSSDNTVVTSVGVVNTDRTRYFLAADVNYSQAYVPQYNGSPATKKYVDDAISNSVTNALGGSY